MASAVAAAAPIFSASRRVRPGWSMVRLPLDASVSWGNQIAHRRVGSVAEYGGAAPPYRGAVPERHRPQRAEVRRTGSSGGGSALACRDSGPRRVVAVQEDGGDRKSTRLNSSHMSISYAVFCLKKKKKKDSRVRDTRTHEH